MAGVEVRDTVARETQAERSGLPQGWLMILPLALTIFAALYLQRPPRPVVATAPPSDFSSARALRHIEAIAQRPRPIGSAESAAAREYITGQLLAQGLDAQVQTAFADRPERGSPYAAGTVRNVVARFKGTGGDKAVLLAAHYDSVPTGPGASDDGVGTAALLETARALKSGPPPANDVIFLFTEGEEVGLLGARAFAARHEWAKDVGVVMNFEARGNEGPVIMFETSGENRWMIEELAAAAPDPVANSLSAEIYKRMPNDTDFTVFRRGGVPGMNFAHIGGLTHYHTATDDLKSVSESSLQHHGSYALSLARGFGARRSAGQSPNGNAVYFMFGPLLVRYGGAFVLPSAVLAVLLYVFVLFVGFRRGRLTAKGIIFGASALVAACAAATLTVTLVWRVARPLHRGFDSTPWGDPNSGGFYGMGLSLLTVAVVAALYNWFRRRSSVANLAVGALLCWVLLVVAVSLLTPGASYAVWPLLCALVATAVLFLTPERGVALRWVGLAASAVTAGAIFAPVLALTFDALTLNAAGVVAFMLALICGLLVPHLGVLARPRPWVLPTAAASAGLVLIVSGLVAAAAGPPRPTMDNIFYALNADTGEARWGSADDARDEWTAQFFPTGGERLTMPDFYPTAAEAKFLTGAAQAVALPAPEVTLLEDKRDGEARTLRVRVASPRHAPLVSIYAAFDGELLGASISGAELPTKFNPSEPWGLHYYAFPEEGAELTLRVKTSGPIDLRVNDLSRSLPAGLPVRPRPANVIPSPLEFSDATLVSKSFKL
jgi:hypothetical protein